MHPAASDHLCDINAAVRSKSDTGKKDNTCAQKVEEVTRGLGVQGYCEVSAAIYSVLDGNLKCADVLVVEEYVSPELLHVYTVCLLAGHQVRVEACHNCAHWLTFHSQS